MARSRLVRLVLAAALAVAAAAGVTGAVAPSTGAGSTVVADPEHCC